MRKFLRVVGEMSFRERFWNFMKGCGKKIKNFFMLRRVLLIRLLSGLIGLKIEK